MSAQDPNRVFWNPGRWCLTPTDLTTAYPHGGTALGYMGACEIRWNVQYEEIAPEGLSGQLGDVWETPGTPVMGCTIRQWDVDLLDEIFPSSTSTSGGAERRLSLPFTPRLLASTGSLLVYSPYDPRKPGIILFNAAGTVAGGSATSFNLPDPQEFVAVFYCLQNGSGNALDVDLLENLDARLP